MAENETETRMAKTSTDLIRVSVGTKAALIAWAGGQNISMREAADVAIRGYISQNINRRPIIPEEER